MNNGTVRKVIIAMGFLATFIAGAIVGVGTFLTATGLSAKNAEDMIKKERLNIAKDFLDICQKGNG